MQVLLHRLQIKVEDRFNLHFIEFYFTFPSHRFETFRLRSITDGVLGCSHGFDAGTGLRPVPLYINSIKHKSGDLR